MSCKQQILEHWGTLRFGGFAVERIAVGRHEFRTQLILGRLDIKLLAVELYAEASLVDEPALESMKSESISMDIIDVQTCTTNVAAIPPASEYTARVICYHASAYIPLETGPVLWQP